MDKLKSLIYKLKIKFMKGFGHIKIHPYPLWVTIEPTTFDIKGKSYYEVKKLIKPGDILLRGYKRYLNVYFIPGEFSHVAYYVGGEDEKIIHAVSPAVEYTDLVTFMRADSVAILRIPTLTDDEIKIATERAEKKIGLSYDYDFLFEKEDTPQRFFSCSELLYYIMRPFQEKTGWKLEYMAKIAGMFKDDIFLPDHTLPNGDESKTEIIWIKRKS